MSRAVVLVSPRNIALQEVEVPAPGPRQIRVRTLFSGISHGTEMAWYRGTAPGWTKHLVDGLYAEGPEPRTEHPLCLGYEEVAEVVEVGSEVTEVAVGDRITSAYGHREEAVLNVEGNDYLFTLPPETEPERFIFLALGGVALDSYLTSRVRLGESAVVFGLGVIGLLLVQMLKLGGVKPVLGVEPLARRRELAWELGADEVLDPAETEVGRTVRQLLGETQGADVVFETSGNYAALQEAIRCGAPGYSKLVATAFYQGPAEALRLGEEFHHGGSLRQGGCTQIVINDHRLPPAFGRAWDRRRILRTVFHWLASAP